MIQRAIARITTLPPVSMHDPVAHIGWSGNTMSCEEKEPKCRDPRNRFRGRFDREGTLGIPGIGLEIEGRCNMPDNGRDIS